ncbi:hypothetical protein FC52_GL001636 [Lactobacillus pasteurii DSM 23907 = CRBIP 24.76]|uniref:Copper-exporting ATPase n=1 Tax=Lactobacillus pasteurii DSM 23907 = CRBIP 24.76 TaxID=1423790 RepID=I7LAD9_9LACO|nr:cupredoxin domain-containing protein [Lactobacillus pasteurii]KRK07605.1 hypothetical protein FC52_GL001636 [Lactobacillus pasteurii DSM 23907 = CRBIP 24.76]TDG77124.1 hypothetical protein C5L33_000317 [Lactobacillus pasteurii]CCI84606.1 Copper-exporting ATPase [Lactobacillus pasteurii DSM 23907 = CRBIP 24.76]
MTISQILILLVAIALIIFIVWWFFAPRQEQAASGQIVNNQQIAEIVVNGGYSPSTIVLKKGIPAKVKFNLQDSTACLSRITFEQLGVNTALDKDQAATIEIPTDKATTFNFACGMDMFHGKVVVK